MCNLSFSLSLSLSLSLSQGPTTVTHCLQRTLMTDSLYVPFTDCNKNTRDKIRRRRGRATQLLGEGLEVGDPRTIVKKWGRGRKNSKISTSYERIFQLEQLVSASSGPSRSPPARSGCHTSIFPCTLITFSPLPLWPPTSI